MSGGRIVVEAPPGLVRDNPGDALGALAAVAAAEGADPDEWVAKALHAHGVTHVEHEVGGEPRFRIVEDGAAQAGSIFDRALRSATAEIVALLEERGAPHGHR